MIHLELLHQSPFRLIGLMRIYIGVPQDQNAYFHRLDYDYTCVVVYQPHSRKAEIKGLASRASRGSKTEYNELLEFLHTRLGATEVVYERANGKRLSLHCHGPRHWKVYRPRKNATPQVDITMISG